MNQKISCRKISALTVVSWLTFLFLKDAGKVAVLSKVVKAGSAMSSLAFASLDPFFDSFAPISGDCKLFTENVHNSEIMKKYEEGQDESWLMPPLM